MTLETIVKVVLVLLVLAILIFIAVKYVAGKGGEIGSCEATIGGKCSIVCRSNEFSVVGDCPIENEKCCKSITGNTNTRR